MVLLLQGHDVPVSEKYTFSVFRSVAQVLGMGYSLHQPPTTLVEVWLAMASFLIGGIFYAVFIAQMSNLILNHDRPAKKYTTMVSHKNGSTRTCTFKT